MIANEQELLDSSLAILSGGGLDDAGLEQRVTRFQGALHRLREDRDEAARVDAIAMGADRSDTGQMHAGFMEFYDREYLHVVRFVMRCGASLQQAEDATQDAFLEAWKLAQNPSAWDGIHNPQGWIRTSALRKYRRLSGPRRQPGMLTATAVPQMPQPGSGHADLTQETLLVYDALRALEFGQRAIMAFHLDGFSVPEIGRELEMTEPQVRLALKKARESLAVMFSGDQR